MMKGIHIFYKYNLNLIEIISELKTVMFPKINSTDGKEDLNSRRITFFQISFLNIWSGSNTLSLLLQGSSFSTDLTKMIEQIEIWIRTIGWRIRVKNLETGPLIFSQNSKKNFKGGCLFYGFGAFLIGTFMKNVLKDSELDPTLHLFTPIYPPPRPPPPRRCVLVWLEYSSQNCFVPPYLRNPSALI